MTVHVFVGPTLSEADVRNELDAQVHGPVAFGDVCRLVPSRPLAILIIDGYFERQPAVWHKEILWALAEGVHVFGAASMGALRAAELCAFGMQGIGAIFEAFVRGELEDDDEVTVAHAPAEQGYTLLSDAMVNVRATLAAAVDAGIVEQALADILVQHAKARFYAERSFPAMVADAAAAGVADHRLRVLREWLPSGRVDQKRNDALALLRHVAAWQRDRPGRKRADFRFARTDAWHEALRSVGSGEGGSASSGLDALVVEDLKLQGAFVALRSAASLRAVALSEAREAGLEPDAPLLRATVAELRREHGLLERRAFEAWRDSQRLDANELERFFRDEAKVRWASPTLEALAETQLVDELRARGRYGELLSQAQAKRRFLTETEQWTPSLSDLGLTEVELWRRHFEQRGIDPAVDLGEYARGLGFRDVDELRTALLRDLLFHGREPRDRMSS